MLEEAWIGLLARAGAARGVGPCGAGAGAAAAPEPTCSFLHTTWVRAGSTSDSWFSLVCTSSNGMYSSMQRSMRTCARCTSLTVVIGHLQAVVGETHRLRCNSLLSGATQAGSEGHCPHSTYFQSTSPPTNKVYVRPSETAVQYTCPPKRNTGVQTLTSVHPPGLYISWAGAPAHIFWAEPARCLGK